MIFTFLSARQRRGLIQLADPKIWIASTVPMLTAVTLAYVDAASFSIGWFLLTLIGIYAVEVGKNAVNEVVDWRSGADRFVSPENLTPFSGGKKTITGGLLSENEVIIIAIASFTVAALIGILIWVFRTWHAFWIAAIGGLLAIGYSMWPLSLAYRGFGEVTVGFTFGPLLMLGTYVVQTGQLSLRPILISIPLGILIAAVLWINEFPDFEADLHANKRNLVVRMGRGKARTVFAILMALAEISIVGLAVYFRSPWLLLGLIGGLEAYRATKVCWSFYEATAQLIPANAGTIKTYILTGLGLILGLLLGR